MEGEFSPCGGMTPFRLEVYEMMAAASPVVESHERSILDLGQMFDDSADPEDTIPEGRASPANSSIVRASHHACVCINTARTSALEIPERYE
jgi:hypothetical protein